MTITECSAHPGRPGVGAAVCKLLDPVDGTARVMGERALYLRILRRFRDDYQDAAARIRAAAASGDARLAHRMVHTLAGASGMICAPVVHRLAGALERNLEGGAGNQAQAIDALGAALDKLLPAIALLLAADAAAPLAQRPAQAALGRLAEISGEPPGEDLVELLAALLAGGNGAALAVVDGSGQMLTAALGEAGYQAVALAVNEFDFDAALEALTQAAQVAQAARARRAAAGS